MNKRNTILVFGVLLLALPVLAMIESTSNKFGKTLSVEKCSSVIEDLKLCIDDSKIIVNSGEPVILHLSWVNLSDVYRRIGTHSSGYSVVINNEKNEKLIPVFVQKELDRKKRIESSGNLTTAANGEDASGIILMGGGSDRGINVEAHETESDIARLNKFPYDYDLTAKGKYNVTVSKTISSLESGKQIEFVIDNIEIKVK